MVVFGPLITIRAAARWLAAAVSGQEISFGDRVLPSTGRPRVGAIWWCDDQVPWYTNVPNRNGPTMRQCLVNGLAM